VDDVLKASGMIYSNVKTWLLFTPPPYQNFWLRAWFTRPAYTHKVALRLFCLTAWHASRRIKYPRQAEKLLLKIATKSRAGFIYNKIIQPKQRLWKPGSISAKCGKQISSDVLEKGCVVFLLSNRMRKCYSRIFLNSQLIYFVHPCLELTCTP